MCTGSDSGSDSKSDPNSNGWSRARGAVLKSLVLVGGALLLRRLTKSTTRWDHARIVAESLNGEKFSKEQAVRDPDNYFNFRWWSNDTIAVVTGSNRGIGFEIARQLASHGITVVLTSRETRAGEEAMKIMQEEGLNVVLHQLDVVDPASIETFSDWIKEKYGGLDILINNAGVNFNFGTDNSVEFAETVIQTNYFGTKSMIKAMIPLMRPSPFGARIVNVTSRLGRLNGRRNRIANVSLRQQLEDVDSLSEELIDSTVNTFLEQVKNGIWESGGWPQVFTDYSLSKLAANAYTRLMARILSDQPEGQKIYMNCYCPGWVKTAMTAWAGHTSPEIAADTAVWLALISDQFVNGKFFAERREINF